LYVISLNSKAEAFEQVMPRHCHEEEEDVKTSDGLELPLRRAPVLGQNLIGSATMTGEEFAGSGPLHRVVDRTVVGGERLLCVDVVIETFRRYIFLS
jgi:hypothetical protein